MRKALLAAAALLLTLDSSGAEEASSVRILSPAQGGHVSGVITIAVETQNPRGIREVSLTRDSSFLETTSTAPYRVDWDTRKEADGPHTLVAKATDTAGMQERSPMVTVLVDNAPPTVNLIQPGRRATVAGPAPMEAEASDRVGVAQVRFLVDGKSVGTAEVSPYRTTWDSVSVSNGVHTVEATAFDRAGNHATSEFCEIRVANRNQPPVLAPVSPKKITEGETLDFRIFANDPDGPKDTVTFRAVDPPPWVTFHSKTGEFHAAPTPDAATLQEPDKVYTVRVQACDPEPLCSTLAIPITVRNVNQPPKLKKLQDLKIQEMESVRVGVEASDPDRDELTYTAQGLPRWLTFDPSTRTITGTPGVDVATGHEPAVAYKIKLKACDPENLCDETTFVLTIINKNSPPIFKNIPDLTLVEGGTYTFTVEATDADGDKIELKPVNLPPGALFEDQKDGRGIFVWGTGLDLAGRYTVTFVASDGITQDTEELTVTLQEQSYSVSGWILDNIGDPFPGAVVYLTAAGQHRQSVTTDKKGYYIASGLDSGRTYTVKPDYAVSEEFSTQIQTTLTYHFAPLSQRVTLDRADRRDINFKALRDS